MQACVVRVRPSLRAQFLAVIMHGLALTAVVLYSTGWQRALFLLVWVLSVLWAGYGLLHTRIKRIEINGQEQASLILTSRKGAIPAVLSTDSVIRARLMALRWQTAKGSVYQLLLPDMTDAPSWRRLQVWARWCQPHTAQVAEPQSILYKVIHWLRLRMNN